MCLYAGHFILSLSSQVSPWRCVEHNAHSLLSVMNLSSQFCWKDRRDRQVDGRLELHVPLFMDGITFNIPEVQIRKSARGNIALPRPALTTETKIWLIFSLPSHRKVDKTELKKCAKRWKQSKNIKKKPYKIKRLNNKRRILKYWWAKKEIEKNNKIKIN